MAIPIIDELYPDPRSALDREALAELYGRPGASSLAAAPWIRVNFVSTLDGSATGPDGLSGSISSAADKVVFGVLRRLADAVLVAAGTVRQEGYEGALVSPAQRAWRLENGLNEHPGFVVASRRLDLDPAAPVFERSPVRPVIVTYENAPDDRRAALASVADVVEVGESSLDAARLRAALSERGWTDVLCEGGPSFAGELAAVGGVDELCLTVVPKLVAGEGPRIAHGAPAALGLRLAHILRGEDDALLLRHTR